MGFTQIKYYEYSYDGPVLEYGRVVANRWSSKTYAPTAKKARSNLAYQFKKQFNREPMVKITLPGDVIKLGGEEKSS